MIIWFMRTPGAPLIIWFHHALALQTARMYTHHPHPPYTHKQTPVCL
jgi:hypothetical protein